MYNEIKQHENQPITLDSTYKENINFLYSIKPDGRGKSIYYAIPIIKVLKADSCIIDVAAKINTSVFFNSGTFKISGIINGIDVSAEEKLFKTSDYIIDGVVEDLE